MEKVKTVVCNNDLLTYELTKDKPYTVKETLSNGHYVIINDKGQEHIYSPKRFD